VRDLKGRRGEDVRWMELAQDRVQWQALVLAVLNLGLGSRDVVGGNWCVAER
jgi:hypothetical protein